MTCDALGHRMSAGSMQGLPRAGAHRGHNMRVGACDPNNAAQLWARLDCRICLLVMSLQCIGMHERRKLARGPPPAGALGRYFLPHQVAGAGLALPPGVAACN